MNGLRVTPRQLFEASRLADRLGPAFAQGLNGGRLLLLMATKLDADGRAEPDLALELDADGQVVAAQYLDLAHPADEDEFGDLADDEAPLPEPLDMSQARPAKVCECPAPWGDDGTCGICGHALAASATTWASSA